VTIFGIYWCTKATVFLLPTFLIVPKDFLLFDDETRLFIGLVLIFKFDVYFFL